MNKKIILKIIAFLIIFSGVSLDTNCCKNELKIVKESPVYVEKPENKDWEIFTEAIILKESRGIENAVGDNGKAIGVLQLHKVMVDEANRILVNKKIDKRYTYDDRYSREKSIEIFNVVQNYKNKKKDKFLALEIWNPNHPKSYENDIMNNYNTLKSNA